MIEPYNVQHSIENVTSGAMKLRLTHDVIFVANSLYTFEELSVKSVNHDVSKVKLTSKFSKRAEKKQITSYVN